MASQQEWALGYARQAAADFKTFEKLQSLAIPECHKLQFLQMACEKLVKAHLCQAGADPKGLEKSHGYVAGTLPVVLRQYVTLINFSGPKARDVLKRAKHLAQEINVLAPAVKRAGDRPDNCEYPWTDPAGNLHVPLDWSFGPSQLLVLPGGSTFLKLIQGAINQMLKSLVAGG
jgi:hypothetical protein